MPNPNRAFQSNYAKKAKTSDNYRQRKYMNLEMGISGERKERLKDWITFYRLNIDIFATHYLQLRLHFYQRIWLYLMNVSDIFVTFAARACGKTWLLAVMACCRAILWPGSEIVLVSSTQKQASLLISEKIYRLKEDSLNLQREIKEFAAGNNRWEVVFHNGSKIKVVCAGEGGRGSRSTFTIYEEFRLLEKEVVDSIVKPFAYSRQAPYLQLDEYKGRKELIEEPKEVYISSAYYKQHWSYEFLKTVIKMMLAGKNAGVIFYDYLVTLEAGIKTENQIEKEKQTMSTETFEQEYCNLILGAGENSFFNFNYLNRSRKLSHALYPQRELEYNPRKNPYDTIKKVEGEIRLLSADLALRSGSKNDNTIMILFRLIPLKKRGYTREILFIESHNGLHSALQTLRIKQLVEDFSVDLVCLDVQNFGFTIYEQLGMVTKDEKRGGKEYPPFTIIDHPSIDQKLHDDCVRATLGVGAIKNVYPISADAKFNSDIAILLKDRFKKGMFYLLKNENDAEDVLMKNKTYLEETKDDSFLRSWYINPFVQTSLMISEVLGLEMNFTGNGLIKLIEKPGQRKDRYSALAYGNFVASLFDQDLLRETEDVDDWGAIEAVTFVM